MRVRTASANEAQSEDSVVVSWAWRGWRALGELSYLPWVQLFGQARARESLRFALAWMAGLLPGVVFVYQYVPGNGSASLQGEGMEINCNNAVWMSRNSPCDHWSFEVSSHSP